MRWPMLKASNDFTQSYWEKDRRQDDMTGPAKYLGVSIFVFDSADWSFFFFFTCHFFIFLLDRIFDMGVGDNLDVCGGICASKMQLAVCIDGYHRPPLF
ncbi:hypothetical protein IF1G_01995 [Cordyceps javanica]|uniref:Uncharacterized protein n=1 Tax=Cordyceps javanica TaxID=43265 RepID=A0A545VDH6_9HYPO|nr:hypothetical protein IF1G_01995 [Cordyceps javanica]